MTRTATSIIALAFALSAAPAFATSGNNMTGEGLFPVAVSTTTAMSRDQVRAELSEAVRDGSLIANNVTGETVSEAAPASFAVVEPHLSREQVKAELAEAVRDGSLIANNVTGETFSQRYPSRYAHIGSGADAS